MIIVKIKAYYCDIGISIITQPYLFYLQIQLFVRARYVVALFDTSDEQRQGAQKDIEQKLTTLEEEGLLGEGLTASQCLKNISFFNNLQDAVCGAAYIQVCFESCVSSSLLSDLSFIIEYSRVNWISCKHGCSSNYWIQSPRLQIKLLVGKCYNWQISCLMKTCWCNVHN